MKHLYINTKKSGNELAINNGFSFPAFSGSTNLDYNTTSTSYKKNVTEDKIDEKTNSYTICVDWLEFICTCDEPIELAIINNQCFNIIVEKVSVHRNPNFRNLHRVYYNGVEACEIFSAANNGIHSHNEVAVKVSNVTLYSKQYHIIICYLLDTFGLTFKRYARIDIALDGEDILKMVDLLNKYSRSYTIQSSNDAVSILPTAFNKRQHRWLSWSIGKGKSGISARIYDKTNEVTQSRKQYVVDYWQKNGITTSRIGRFEIQLNYKRLKKYQLDMSSMVQLSDAEFVGAIFTNEVKSWLRLYRVLKKDMINHKKEVAIKKGKEIQFINWSRLPTNMELLTINRYVSNSNYISARNTISFNLREILHNPDTSTTLHTEIIQKYATQYNLHDYVDRKIRTLFGLEIQKQYLSILNPLMKEGDRCKDVP